MSFIDDTSYLALTSSGRANKRTKWVGTITVVAVLYLSIAASVASASKRPRMTDETPATSRRMPLSGPVWYMGPTTRWVPNPASLFFFNPARCSAILPPPANMVGGSSVPLGSPVVPDVYSRLGSGMTSIGGCSGLPASNQEVHDCTPAGTLSPHMITVSTPASVAACWARETVDSSQKITCDSLSLTM